jgi:serine/threonine-protein phosphatase PP1-1
MTDSKVPQPGPAKLKRNAGPDEWLEAAKDCKYLSEAHMKQLCEMVKEYMMEGKPRDEHTSTVGYQISHSPLA